VSLVMDKALKTVTAPKRSLTITSALFVVLVAINLVHVYGNEEQSDTGDIPTSVSPPSEPTQVTVGAYLIGLSRVSAPVEAFPSFEVEMFIDLTWQDKRLAYQSDASEPLVFLEEEAAEKLSEIWSPDIEIENEVEQRTTESIELIILPDGTVEYEERFGAILHAELDLQRFPFDEQTFELEIQSFVWDQDQIILVVNEQQLGMDQDFLIPEWQVFGIDAFTDLRSEIRDDRAFSTYTFRIQAKRRAGHYIIRILLPLMFVMLLTWIAFWIRPADRIRVGFIALLTVVATHTIISQSLPILHYPTFSDILLTVCYLFATALIIESTCVRHLEVEGDDERASRIDKRTRLLLPLMAIIAVVVCILVLWF
jgi:hypothetical protein